MRKSRMSISGNVRGILLAMPVRHAVTVPASADKESYKIGQGSAVMPAGIGQGLPTGHPRLPCTAVLQRAAPVHVLVAIFGATPASRGDANVTAKFPGWDISARGTSTGADDIA